MRSMARSGGMGLVGTGRAMRPGTAGQWQSGVPGSASELSAFDERVQAPVNFTQTAFDRSLVIFGELSHKFVPSCCCNLLSRGRGRKARQAGRSSVEDWHGGWLRLG